MDNEAWGDMSSEYDNNVENNTDFIISGYISEEIRLAANLCKKIIKPDTKYTIIDMGSGTGRVLFALQQILGGSISYYGLDAAKSMVELSEKKQSNSQYNKISFLEYDITNPEIGSLFDDDSIKITMCMYNTVGVITPSKRQQFFQNMTRLAGKDGLALVSAFNGDNFAFVAPKIYTPMKKMVKQIDADSFDEERLAFRNSLGYYSQWFTKTQLLELLHSDANPIPINISLKDEKQSHTFGHIFPDRVV